MSRGELERNTAFSQHSSNNPQPSYDTRLAVGSIDWLDAPPFYGFSSSIALPDSISAGTETWS